MLFTLTAFDSKTKTHDEIYSTRESPLFVPLKGDLIKCFGDKIALINDRIFKYEQNVGVHLTVAVDIVRTDETKKEEWRSLGRQI